MRAMRRLGPLWLACLASLTALAVGGCYFVQSPSRPLQALTFRRDSTARQPCLVVFLPGMLDGPDTYRQHGFPDDVLRSGAACDSVAINLHYRYYGEGGVADMIWEDVLQPAIARGYEEIWLVGISMGGLGTVLTASQHNRHIAGVILLSPFLGEEPFLRSIGDAGGLEAWHPPDPMPTEITGENYSLFMWAWLRGYIDDPDGMPPLYLGWAENERLAPAAEMLAAALPEGRVLTAEGAHNWATWRPLFRAALDRARPGRGGGRRTVASR
jgi:pimeloyl-ACP methyl ester carboxylesterase